jgi:hypothetical protein
MFIRLLLIVFILVTGCADNPLDLEPGMWVRYKVDGELYYITDIVQPTGRTVVRDSAGEFVQGDFYLYDFELIKTKFLVEVRKLLGEIESDPSKENIDKLKLLILNYE